MMKKEKIIQRKKKELQQIRKMVRDFSEVRLLLIQPFFDELKEKKSYFKTPLKTALKKSRFRSGVFHEEDKENIPKEKSRQENRNNNKKSFHEETDKENFSEEKSHSLLLVPAGNRIGPRSGLISSSEIAKQTPTKLPKRTNVVALVVNKPLRVILKPSSSLTKRRINHQQRIQLLSSFYFK